uniref:Uncharacterized protein n=1 Tax=Aegilops tauschii TaxID=37682 RepID=M8BSS1_AEGTA
MSGFAEVLLVLARSWEANTEDSSLKRLAALAIEYAALIGVGVTSMLLGGIAMLYVFICISESGLYVTTGLSLWRLIEHDYGDADGDPSKANMRPALDVLYILLVLQGAILAYRKVTMLLVGDKVATEVAEEYGFKGRDVDLVLDYMKEIRVGCLKDQCFAKGKNLARYAVGLMGPDRSEVAFCEGARILSILLGPVSTADKPAELDGQRKLMKELIGCSSSIDYIFNKLLRISRRNPYDREMLNKSDCKEDREMMKCATRIVLHVAGEISLEQFPQVIQCISTHIGTFEEYHQRAFGSDSAAHDCKYEKEEGDYVRLVWQGMNIIYMFTADENGCRVISDTRGLLSKIMGPLTSDVLHQTVDHDSWGSLVGESLCVICRLTAAPGKTGARLRCQISINKKAVNSILRIIECDKCYKEHKTVAMAILMKLYMDIEIREDFVKMLVGIFTNSNEDRSIRILAVEALAKLCFQGESNVMVILQANSDAVDCLIGELAAFNEHNRYLISAAEILENLCIHYTKDDECLKKLKEAMTDLMPKVLSKVLPGDIEDQQKGGAMEGDDPDMGSSTDPEGQGQRVNRETESAVLSLCVTVCDTFISGDQDLVLQFDAYSLPRKLREMVERNGDPEITCLKIVKLTIRIVMSMMKHGGNNYLKEDMERLMASLYAAFVRNKRILNTSMVFVSSDDDGAATTNKPETGRDFESLIDEALGLFDIDSLRVKIIEVLGSS